MRGVLDELGIDADVEYVAVPDADAAERTRFLGSPTVRVNGRDVEPDAAERTTYVHSCRVYQTDTGFSGTPSDEWVRAALLEAR